jgi:hypothetical protein
MRGRRNPTHLRGHHKGGAGGGLGLRQRLDHRLHTGVGGCKKGKRAARDNSNKSSTQRVRGDAPGSASTRDPDHPHTAPVKPPRMPASAPPIARALHGTRKSPRNWQRGGGRPPQAQQKKYLGPPARNRHRRALHHNPPPLPNPPHTHSAPLRLHHTPTRDNGGGSAGAAGGGNEGGGAVPPGGTPQHAPTAGTAGPPAPAGPAESGPARSSPTAAAAAPAASTATSSFTREYSSATLHVTRTFWLHTGRPCTKGQDGAGGSEAPDCPQHRGTQALSPRHRPCTEVPATRD